MNSAAAALVSAAAIASILGVYSAAVGSEVRIAGEAADMIASMAAASNEALSASYDAHAGAIVVRNHGAAPARLFMADVVAEGGARVRVALAPEGYAAPPGMAVVNGTVLGSPSREIAPGAAASVPLAGAMAAAAAAALAEPGRPAARAHPASASITTDAGTRVAVSGGLPAPAAAAAAGPGGGQGRVNGTGDGTATVSGMGISSRIVHERHGGFSVSGEGVSGRISVPAGPYVEVGRGRGGFAGVVLAGDPSTAAAVPSLFGSYALGAGGALAPATGGPAQPAPLAYASKRILEGSPSVSRDGQGLQLRGPGRVLLELQPGEGGASLLLVSGSASGGASLLVGPSPYGLAGQAYSAGRGFEVWRGPAAGPAASQFGAPPCPPSGRAEFSASYWWDVPSVAVGLRGPVSHGAAAAANNNLPDPGTGLRGEPLMPAAGRVEYGPGGGGMYRTVEGLSMRSGSSPQLNGPAACGMRPATVLPSIYDAAPVAAGLAAGQGSGGGAGGRFEAVLAAPGSGRGAHYAIAHLDSPSASLSLSARQASPGEAILSLRGLPASVPYTISSGGAALAAGVTSGAGTVSLAAADMGLGPRAAGAAESHCAGGAACPGGRARAAVPPDPAAARVPGAVLHLYEESLAVRGRPAGGALAYDPLHGESLPVPSWRPGTVYVVHAWARIPVVGQVAVSGAALNGTLPLPFLGGTYGAGNLSAAAAGGPAYVHVPIIPRYSHVSMSVNGAPAALAFADAAAAGGPGGGSVRVLPPSSSAASTSDPSGPLRRATAQAGAATAHVAPRDGSLGAVFAVEASGSARIDNTYALRAAGDSGWTFNASAAAQAPPSPPGRPAQGPHAPLSAHVVVRVNGDEVAVVPLGPPAPAGPEARSVSAGAGSVLASVAYGPLEYAARGSAAVPVRAGDLVEFEVAVNATASAQPYVPPAGAEAARSTGSASASASLLSGTVIAGM